MRFRRFAWVVSVLASASLACGGDENTDAPYSPDVDAGLDAETDTVLPDVVQESGVEEASPDAPVEDTGGPSGPLGFIGSPCEGVAECDFDEAVCLTESDGFPAGHCSMPCDNTCPDRDGHPTTFCIEATEIAAPMPEGACVSRCDMGLFPETGCRPGYGCVLLPRANESETQTFACVPGRPSELTPCHLELAARGVSFEPAYIADQSPDTHPNLTCHVEEPVYVHSPLHGVTLASSGGTETPRVLASCAMAHALTDTVDDVAPLGVVTLRHMGTFNCRVIAGTDSLSRHAFGDAIDIAGFELSDGSLYTLVDDWEHDTDSPQTAAGAFLYEAAHRWYDAWIWTIILTPNYNVDHDDHFHVDLTPESHFLEFHGGHFIGPAPYAD